MKTIKNIAYVAYREFLRIVKDINLITVILLAPLAYPALYGVIYVNKIEEKVPVGVIDEDNSSLSRMLIRDINALQSTRISENYINPEKLKEALANGEVHAAVYIPKDFAKNIKKGKKEAITLMISPGRLLVLGDVGFGISQVVNTFGAKITATVLSSQGVPVFQDRSLITPFKFEWTPMYNPYLSYGDMILPALIIIIMSQLVVIGSAAATAREWSDKTWLKLFQFADNNYFSIIFGKYLTITCIFAFFAVLVRLIIVPIFGVYFAGDSIDVYILILLGIMASSAFGIFLGTFFKYRITAFAFLGFTTYPMFMISGYAWPTAQLPILVQYLSYVFPLTPFVQSIQSVTQLGNDLSYVQTNIMTFIIQIVAYTFLTAIRMLYIHYKSKKVALVVS